jgi:hypothetical protein
VELDVAIALLRSARLTGDDALAAELAIGTRIGNYEIIGECLGGGGTGQVYPATHQQNGGAFALKLARPGVPERIFLEERHKARLLNHPNILVAHDGGSHEGRPYLVFRRLESHLTEGLRGKRFSKPPSILTLMQKLTKAVRFAHGRGVLHCDLKPSNVLFDAEHEPHVADFGLARTLEASGSSGDVYGGARGWMSPEQVEGRSIGVESDVFTLGVVLYWLLQGGKLPFGSGNDFEERLRSTEPDAIVAGPRWGSSLSWDLAMICRKALCKSRTARYQTVAALEEDLDRAAEGRVPRAAGSVVRLVGPVRWLRRRPLLALGSLVALCLPGYAFWIQNDALREVRAALRPHSRFTAKAQARAVVSELYSMSLRVRAMAQDPEVAALVTHPGIGHPAIALRPHAVGFDSVNVFAGDGLHTARWPVGPQELATNATYTDHFRCAVRLAERRRNTQAELDSSLSVCVAKAHRSRLDGKVKVGLAAPLLRSGRLIGVVEASTMARDRFGGLQMSCGPGDCFTALLGPRDRDVSGKALPGVLSILAQQDIELGSEVRLPLELSQRICKRLDCEPDPLRPFDPEVAEPFEIDPYQDPVTSKRSLAILAPVGRTGLSVLIATPHSATQAQLAGIAALALRGGWIPVLFGSCLWLLLLVAPNPRWPWRHSEKLTSGKRRIR